MTKLEEIKAKVDAVIESYRNEEGNILDENGKNLGVLFMIADDEKVGMTKGSTNYKLSKILCSVIKETAVNNSMERLVFMMRIIQECVVLQSFALLSVKIEQKAKQ